MVPRFRDGWTRKAAPIYGLASLLPSSGRGRHRCAGPEPDHFRGQICRCTRALTPSFRNGLATRVAHDRVGAAHPHVQQRVSFVPGILQASLHFGSRAQHNRRFVRRRREQHTSTRHGVTLRRLLAACSICREQLLFQRDEIGPHGVLLLVREMLTQFLEDPVLFCSRHPYRTSPSRRRSCIFPVQWRANVTTSTRAAVAITFGSGG